MTTCYLQNSTTGSHPGPGSRLLAETHTTRIGATETERRLPIKKVQKENDATVGLPITAGHSSQIVWLRSFFLSKGGLCLRPQSLSAVGLARQFLGEASGPKVDFLHVVGLLHQPPLPPTTTAVTTTIDTVAVHPVRALFIAVISNYRDDSTSLAAERPESTRTINSAKIKWITPEVRVLCSTPFRTTAAVLTKPSTDPCPWVIANDFGGAFAMGAVGGTIWHGVKGFRNSPYGERRMGAITAIKMRAPVLGGEINKINTRAVWGSC